MTELTHTDDAAALTDTLVHNASTSNFDRLGVVAALINVFNYAIQVQAGRNNWDEYDAQSFSVALGAIDRIGSRHRNAFPVKAETHDNLEDEMGDIIRNGSTRIAPNRMK